MNFAQLKNWTVRLTAILLLGALTNSCYIYNFFKRNKKKHSDSAEQIFGAPIGDRAGGLDDAALAAVHAVPAKAAPSAIRPDPDTFVRNLLREYRGEGATIARQIGRVEQFRLLLGGATEDFAKAPQETYDATSLLAVAKVAEEVCRGLVAPNSTEHPGWDSILPHAASSESENVRWLAQRFLGKPSGSIPSSQIDQLIAIMRSEESSLSANTWARGNAYAKYVSVCATLALDAEALYL